VKRSRLRPVSAKRAAARDDAEPTVQIVYSRDGHRCVLAPDNRAMFTLMVSGRRNGKLALAEALSAVGKCAGQALTPHHLRKAGQGGSWSPENLVTLCAAHNGWVENEPEKAHLLGLVIWAGETYADAWAAMRRAGIPAGAEIDPSTGGLL
jgi:hypothetical protein